jgi:hypothetical protein
LIPYPQALAEARLLSTADFDCSRSGSLRTVFGGLAIEDLPVDMYCKSLEAMGVPPYIVQHLSGAMEDYQHGARSGADDNIEKLPGKKPMSVGDFARAHLDQLNPQKSNAAKTGA